MNNFYTYAHTKPDGTIFYIGQGTKAHNRAYHKGGRSKYWHNIVNKYGYQVQILADWKTSQEAKDHEILLISCLKDMGIKLVNLTDGGEGLSGMTFSDEHKQKLSKSRLGNQWAKGQQWSDESKMLIAESNRRRKGIPTGKATFAGKTHTEEHKAYMSQKLKGRVFSEETRLKMSAAQKLRFSK
jgi:hypothetical protein